MYRHLVTSLAIVVALLCQACHQVKPDQFCDTVADCTAANPAASPALSAVQVCLVDIAANDASTCLGSLVTGAQFAANEITCIVAHLAQTEQAPSVAVAAASPSQFPASAWLAQRRIVVTGLPAPAK